MKTPGEYLKEQRLARGFSGPQLAKLADTTPQQIDRLERGQRKLTREWAERIAPHLKVSAERLIFPDPHKQALSAETKQGLDPLATENLLRELMTDLWGDEVAAMGFAKAFVNTLLKQQADLQEIRALTPQFAGKARK